ncbi:MAG: DUF2339 domain-containing protein [Ornithinimicrobium sp.]
MEALLVALAVIVGIAVLQIRALRQSVTELRQRLDVLNHEFHADGPTAGAPGQKDAPSQAEAQVATGLAVRAEAGPDSAYRSPPLRAPGESAPASQPPPPGMSRLAPQPPQQQAPGTPARPSLAAPGQAPRGPEQQPPIGEPLWQAAPTPPVEPKGPTDIQRAGRAILGYFTGGNVVVRVGAIVLFFGVAFLLRYASEQGLLTVPITVRLAGVAAAGLGLLAIGWRLRHRRRGYALVLQGTGVGIVYITVFAALQLFNVLPGGISFVLMIVMVALTAVLAVAQDSVSLAVVAVIGGFLAPILAATGGGGLASLFGYYFVLNIGILAIAWFRSWRALNLLGFAFTFVIAAMWGGLEYQPSDRPVAQWFLIAFLVLYVVITVLFADRQPSGRRGLVDATLVFGVPVVAFGLQASLVAGTEYGLAIAAGSLGVFYGVLRLACRLLGGPAYLRLGRAFLALGLVFGSICVPLAVDGQWVATIWALEGAAVLWVAIAQRSWLSMLFALTLQVVAGVLYLPEAFTWREGETAVLNSVFLGGVMLAIAALVSSWLLRRAVQRDGYRKEWMAASWAMAAWGLLWWLFTGVNEIGLHVQEPYAVVIWLLFFAATALALGALEIYLKWEEWRFTAVGLLVIIFGVVVPVSLLREHPFGDGYIGGWFAIFGAFYALMWLCERRSGVPLWALDALHTGAWWLAALLLSAEAVYLAGTYEPGVSLDGTVVAGPLVLAAMVWVARKAPIWPWRPRRQSYLRWGSGLLAVFLVAWSLVVAPTRPPGSADVAYLPLLNPVDVAQIAVLVTLVTWWRQVSEAGTGRVPRRYGWWVLCGVSFVWLSTVVLRTLSAWADIAYDLEVLWSSDLAQASVSILWTLIALTAMVLANRHQWRRVWGAAASVLGVVVAKLFLVDMRGSDTLGTVIAFLAVGVLLLIAGYVSPLPPKRSAQDAQPQDAEPQSPRK